MKQVRYLNVILTANAVLVAGLLWTQISAQPHFVQEAAAQGSGGGMVSAGEQRQRMIESLKELEKSVNENTRVLERSTLRVHVENISAFRADDQSSRD